MKRIFALLLIALMLCGCTVSIPTPGESSNVPFDPATATLPPMNSYAEETGLVLTVQMGPEFEMVLNMFHGVLEVNPMNEEAEALLSGVDTAGISYRSAIEAILQEAENQALLNPGANVTLTAKAVGADSWTVASHHILTWPVENYQKNSGLNFTCELIPAGKYFDSASYTDTFTRNYDNRNEVVCYGPGGVHQMTSVVYQDGSYGEYHYPSRDRWLSFTYHADGSFDFADYDDKRNGFTYILKPDGSYDSTSFAEGIQVLWVQRNRDGSSHEAYYENGVTVRSIWTDPDGNTIESTYTVNGNIRTSIYTYTDGSSSEYEYHENGTVKYCLSRNADGSTSEEFYNENGNLIPAPTE